jgi:hypothetical protein
MHHRYEECTTITLFHHFQGCTITKELRQQNQGRLLSGLLHQNRGCTTTIVVFSTAIRA